MGTAISEVVIGLVTSVLSGGAVWVWERGRVARVLSRKAAFFGIEAGGTCLVVMPNTYNRPSSTHQDDVQAMVGVVALAHELGAQVVVESSAGLREGNGGRTEFCIAGPEANLRTRGHMAAHLPGVTVRPYASGKADSLAIEVGGELFRYARPGEAHVFVAKFTPPTSTRPVFVIGGQSAITNRAAVHFLTREYRTLARTLASTERFCVVVRVPAMDVYGYTAAELARDVTDVAFEPAGGPR